MYKGENTTTYYSYSHWDNERTRLAKWFAERADSWEEDLKEFNYKPSMPGPTFSVRVQGLSWPC